MWAFPVQERPKIKRDSHNNFQYIALISAILPQVSGIISKMPATQDVNDKNGRVNMCCRC